MAEFFIHKNLADRRKEIQANIGSLERDLEKARRDQEAGGLGHLYFRFERGGWL